jgi:pilus assembly protein CpaF
MAFPDRYDRYDYNKMVAQVQEHCVQREIPMPRWRDAHDEEINAFHANVLRAIRQLGFQIAEEDRQHVAREVADRIIKMGVLQPFLVEEGIEEVIVRDGFVQVERGGQIEDVGRLASDDYFYALARRIADLEGEELSAEKPQMKVGLPDGSRLTATIPPVSRRGTAINIRRFALRKMTFHDLIELGSIDEEAVDFLAEVATKMNVSVAFSGRPAAGKTTWLNAFSQHLPKRVQVSAIETFQELQLQVPHVHHLIVEEDPEVMGEAINTTILRMRPDVLVIGEVVSREAVEYIMALNLGIVTHTTVHSKSARLTPTRLLSLSRQSDIPVEERREIIGAGLGLVVHLAKEWDDQAGRYRRYMEELLAIRGVRDGNLEMETLKRWDGKGFTPLKVGRELWQAL